MMTELLYPVAAAVGVAIIVVALVAGLLEFVMRAFRYIDERYLSRLVSRRDFMDEAYHPYLDWIEDWSKPMFFYLPVGFRFFNNDNPLPGYADNNSLAFRCPEFSEADSDVLRIVLFGGSAAWGCGSSSNQTTIAGHLERLINEDGRLLQGYKRAECFNLAQMNGNQTQDLLIALFFASRLKPGIAISYTGWNELVTSHFMDAELLRKYGVFYVYEMADWTPMEVAGAREKALKNAFFSWLGANFELGRFLVSRFGPRPEPHNLSPEKLKEHAQLCSELFVDNLERMEDLGRGAGFRHYQFLQPTLYCKPNLTPSEAKVIELYDEVRPRHGGRAVGDFLRGTNIYDAIREAAKGRPGEAAPIYDLHDMFADETEQMFFTLVHLNDEGYLRVAQRIYDTLLADQGAA